MEGERSVFKSDYLKRPVQYVDVGEMWGRTCQCGELQDIILLELVKEGQLSGSIKANVLHRDTATSTVQTDPGLIM